VKRIFGVIAQQVLALNQGLVANVLTVLAILIAILVIYGVFKATYKVVPPHEAHVVVKRGKGMQLFSSRVDPKTEKAQSSYFYVPLLHKRSVLPLRNKQLVIPDIPLRDTKMAKFICDVVCWINITDPVLAAERIGEQERLRDFTGIQDDISDLVKSVTRNSSMKMDIVKIMSERLEFSKSIAEEISASIGEWGIRLVDLECIHFQDSEEYKVIKNLETRQDKVIEATTRQEVAVREKEASIAESDAQRETKLVQAKNLETFRQREIEADEKIGMREQEKFMEIAKTEQKANEQKVEAQRAEKVGLAEVEKERKIAEAEGIAEKVRKEGKADADVIEMKGDANAHVVEATMTAEATGIDRKAEAQKKYQTPAAMAVEIISTAINASKDIEIAKYTQVSQALKEAKIDVIATGEKDFFGIPVSAEAGIALGGMFKAMKGAGFDIEGIFRDLGASVKEMIAGEKSKPEREKKTK